MSPRRSLRLLAAVSALVLLSACRVDTSVSLRVEPNGSGTVTVTVTADKNVVAKAPNLAADVRVDDLKKAGWKVTGPTETDDGGLLVVLEHPFRTPAEATSALSQVNGPSGPLHGLALARTGTDTNSTWTLSGRLEVVGGLQAFADQSALQLLGGAPYAEDIRAMGMDLGDAVGITFDAALPGKVEASTGLPVEDALTWKVPMDGSATDIATTVTNVDVASSIAGVGRWVVAFLLVAWIVGALALLVMVQNARTRRPRTPRF